MTLTTPLHLLAMFVMLLQTPNIEFEHVTFVFQARWRPSPT